VADTLEERGKRPGSVLLVDDDPDMRTMYGSRLRADGFEVLLAADGREALAAMTRPLGLILLDVRMPGMGGLEVLRRMQDGGGAAPAPVVMLTNETDVDAMSACRAMGAVAWWSKFELLPAELSRRVRELLGLVRLSGLQALAVQPAGDLAGHGRELVELDHDLERRPLDV
jgi:two-component system, OmpR family, phosphate regulon response regulator PhoB